MARSQGERWQGDTKDVIDLQIHWVPGHKGFKPNERADEVAKLAAQGQLSAPALLPRYLHSKSLPASISALRQDHATRLQKRWSRRWKTSPRYKSTRSIDKLLPSKNYLQLTQDFSRKQSSIIMQLRTGHIGLNHHLFCIHRSESPSCPHCQGITVETVKHFLLDCPHYRHERHILQRTLRRNAASISFLLNDKKTIRPLLKYINSTG